MKNIYLIASILFFSGVAAGSCRTLNQSVISYNFYSEIYGDTKIKGSIMLRAWERASEGRVYLNGFQQYVRGYLAAETGYDTSLDQIVADPDLTEKYRERLNKIGQFCVKHPELDYAYVTGLFKE